LLALRLLDEGGDAIGEFQPFGFVSDERYRLFERGEHGWRGADQPSVRFPLLLLFILRTLSDCVRVTFARFGKDAANGLLVKGSPIETPRCGGMVHCAASVITRLSIRSRRAIIFTASKAPQRFGSLHLR